MTSPPTPTEPTPRLNATTFAEPGFRDQDHAASDTASSDEQASNTDDGRPPATANTERQDSKDEPPSFLDRIRSAPEAARKKLHLKHAEFQGPTHHMNPTSARMNIRRDSDPRRFSAAPTGDLPPSARDQRRDFEIMWRSRDNRHGAAAVPVSPRGGSITMRVIFSSKDIGMGLYRMITSFLYWDMSFWSGWSYSVGSALFVIDGFWSFLPLAKPSTEFAGEEKYGVPLAFFFGALFYQLGAVMAYLEAVNDGSFAGSAMKRLLLGTTKKLRKSLTRRCLNFFATGCPATMAKLETTRSERSMKTGWILKLVGAGCRNGDEPRRLIP